MWKFKKAVKDETIFIHFSKNYCFPYRTYPSKFVRGESIPTLHLFSLKGEPRILWQGEAEIGGGIYRECLGDIYCSMSGKDLYRLDENGPSLFMRGTTKGRFVGSDIYLYESPDPDPSGEKNIGAETRLIAADTLTKESLWERVLTGGQSLVSYYHFRPLDSDFIMITHREGRGFEVLDPANGSTLWDVKSPEDYKREGKVIATETHVIYVLTRDMDSTADTKIYIHDRHTGELVRVINDVPFHWGYMIHYHFPTGTLYGGHYKDIFAIDPINGKSFLHYKIDLGFHSYCLKTIGELNNEVIFFLRAQNGKELSTVIAHFDTTRNEITYHQHFDNSFGRNRNIEVNKGFLFITDTEGTTHIHERVPD